MFRYAILHFFFANLSAFAFVVKFLCKTTIDLHLEFSVFIYRSVFKSRVVLLEG
jgi:hypothetical protein